MKPHSNLQLITREFHIKYKNDLIELFLGEKKHKPYRYHFKALVSV